MILKNCTINELVDKMKRKKAVCFGVGEFFSDYVLGTCNEEHLEKYIHMLMDNSKEKQNTSINFNNAILKIASVEQIKEQLTSEHIIIITSMHYAEMVKQLNQIKEFDNIECYIWVFAMGKYDDSSELCGILSENAKLTMKIPKVIHWCWFGRNPLPEKERKCVESWKKYCPDYEIIEWNEDNFDINSNQYVKEAYECKKWAFVTDYVRLWAIYNYGGIYMDADVEVLKPLDIFLCHNAFSGFESYNIIPTGIMGGIKGNKWIENLLSYYDNKHFVENGEMGLTSNVRVITQMTRDKYDIKLCNRYTDTDDFVMYPMEIFCPINPLTKEIRITNNTYTIHRFTSSWAKDKSVFDNQDEKLNYILNLFKDGENK